MNKVLITGVAGFIGSQVAKRFIREGYEVIGVDDLSSGSVSNIPKGIEFIRSDLSEKTTIVKLPKDCRKILHLAGQSSGEISFDDPEIDLKKNTISTLNLIRYGLDNDVERIVYASSMSIYGQVAAGPVSEAQKPSPLSCYGVGKLATETYLDVYKNQLPFVALRMFNVYGPGQDLSNLKQGMVSIYVAQALATGRIEVKGSLTRFRDFIYIDDVVEAWFRAGTYTSALGKRLNVGTGRKTTVAELLHRVCSLMPGSTHFVTNHTPGDQTGIFADVAEINNCLGMYDFTLLENGLPKLIDWARGC